MTNPHPSNVPHSMSDSMRALAALNPASPSFAHEAAKIAAVLITIDPAYDPYFQHAARILISGLIMALKVEYGAEANLHLLRQILGATPDKLAGYCATQCAEFGARYPAIVARLGEFTKYSPDDRELSGIRRTAKAHTDWLDSLRHSSQASTNLASFLNPDSTTLH